MKKKCNEPEPGLSRFRKILLVMRFTLFMIVIAVFSTSAASFGQKAKLDLSVKDRQIREILSQIEDQSEYSFMYDNNQVDVSKRVSLDVKSSTIEAILDEIFKGADVTYKVIDRHIMLYPGAESGNVSQQQKTVTGKVTDSFNAPLPGVSVVVKGTTTGTITDFDGKYTLANVPDNAVLVFSFVGMKGQEIAVADKTLINVTLKEEMIGIEEVVAIGYGTIKKSDLTGSVSFVKSEEISAYPSIGMTQALQGRASGVQVQANNGEPGASYNVRIRGGTSVNSSSDPLYVVDGFPGAAFPPVEDIESVEILKDASATSIYGSRGANGVIMITTKRGKSGKTQIDFNASYSLQKEIRRLDLLGPQDFMNYVNEANPGTISGIVDGGTDWQDAILRNGGVQNYQISFSGGNDNVRYYVSGIVYDHKGIVIESKFKRYSITSNIDITASEKIKLGANLFAVRTDQDGVRTQEQSGGTNYGGVISGAYLMAPSSSIYNEDGSFTLMPIGDPADNPYAVATQRKNNYKGDFFQLNLYGELSIAKGLKFKTTVGANINNDRSAQFIPTTLNAGANVGGDAYINVNKSTNTISENYLTYNKLFGDIHDIAFMAGYSYQSSEGEYVGANRQDFITDDFLWWNLAGGSMSLNSPTSGYWLSELSSFYGRFNYKLFDRYLITLNARYDGSSNFAKNNKWAFFPSGAFAWNIAEEDFLQNQDLVSQLKLRTSYGITGNQAIGSYESLARLGKVNTIINGEPVNALRPVTVNNDNLTWESTAQFDIGFDLGMFGQKIYLVADYYQMKTTDLLFSLPLPEYSGFPTMLKNIGSTENKGFEFSLTTVNLDSKLKWETDLNFSLNRNKILELPGGDDIMYTAAPGHIIGLGTTQIMREGAPLGSFFGYVYDGVYQAGDTFLPGAGFEQEAGGEKYRDISGNGILDSDDRTIIGDPNPDFIWGLNNRFKYKGFDLNIFFQASQGNDLYSFTLLELELMAGLGNSTTKALDRWTPTNTGTNIPKANSSRTTISSTRWVMDGSYTRLKNISLGYQVPKLFLNRLGVTSARVYLSGQNILTITGYRGYDPEVNYQGAGSNLNLGLDYGSYPNARSYTIGLQVTF